MITLGSLFDGIGGFPLAGQRNGITAVWASEIEPFPIRVTKEHFPNMKHYGNILNINGADIEIVDIITGGSPCQDLSIAGKRAGMAGARSGLFMEQIRIIKEMREHDRKCNARTDGSVRPRYMLWENVPGAFSSHQGEDFKAVIEEVCRVKDSTITIPMPPKGKWNRCGCIVGDGFSVAWRTLDAQFWGVPQRRRRIYLVADFGGQTAPQILFKQESLSGHIAEGGEEGQEIAIDVGSSTSETGECVILESNQNHAMTYTDGIASTLPASMGMGGGYVPMVATPKTLQIRSGKTGGGKGALIQDNVSATLQCQNMQTLFAPDPVTVDFGRTADRITIDPKVSVTLQGECGGCGAKTGLYCVAQAYSIREDAKAGNMSITPVEVANALQSQQVAPSSHHAQTHVVQQLYESHPMDSRITGPVDVAPTVSSKYHKGTADTPLVQNTVAYGICADASNSMKSGNPYSGIYEADTSRTLDQNGGSPACNQGGIAIVQGYDAYQHHNWRESEKVGPITTRGNTVRGDTPLVTVLKQDCDPQGESATVQAAGFCPEESAQTRGIGYADEMSPTLRNGAIPAVCASTTKETSPQTCLCIEPGALSRGQGERIWDKCPTLRADPGDNHPCIMASYGADLSQKAEGICFKEEVATCVNTGTHGGHGNHVINCDPSGISGAVSSKWAKGTGGPAGDECYNLIATPYGVDCRNATETEELTHTIQAKTQGGVSLNCTPSVRQEYAVRRLTPLECERLQNFPDGWTDIPGASDSARYKAIGNSVAVCCPEFVLCGIKEEIEKVRK